MKKLINPAPASSTFEMISEFKSRLSIMLCAISLGFCLSSLDNVKATLVVISPCFSSLGLSSCMDFSGKPCFFKALFIAECKYVLITKFE